MVRLRVVNKAAYVYNYEISIPLWYDWEFIQPTLILTSRLISIPLWYDWEPALTSQVSQCSVFQFHYGTIESSQPLVQLPLPQYFNSTMVRLRDKLIIVGWVTHVLFQFHYGTIERIMQAGIDSEGSNFNSTMVRLRGALQLKYCRCLFISIPLWYDWESFTSFHELIWLLYFNSTMVRLRALVQVLCR